MSYKRTKYDLQDVYIKGERLKGVFSCSGGWDNPEQLLRSVGVANGFVGRTSSGQRTSTLDISQYIISNHDPIIGLFSDTNLDGELVYGEDEHPFAFTKGVIESYSCSAAVGSIPETSFSIKSYGDMGAIEDGISARDDSHAGDIIVSSPGRVVIDLNGYETNAVQSVKVSASIPWEPINVAGQNHPHTFILGQPINVIAEYELFANDKESSSFEDAFCSPETQNLNVTFYGRCDDEEEIIRKVFVPAARLTSYSKNGQIQDSLSVSLSYNATVLTLSELGNVFSGTAF